MIFRKARQCVSFSCVNNTSTQKLSSWAKRCAIYPVHGHTYTKNSENRGHPFRGSKVFLQPIIKDRPNIGLYIYIWLASKYDNSCHVLTQGHTVH